MAQYNWGTPTYQSGVIGNSSVANSAVALGNVGGANINNTVPYFNTYNAGLALKNVTTLSASLTFTFDGANLTAPFFVGDGSQLTNVIAGAGNSILNGTSNVIIPSNSGNITLGVSGANVILVAPEGQFVTGNISASGTVTSNANITGNYFIGNGSQLTGIITTSSTIFNGTSNVNIASPGGNVVTGIAGNPNVVVVSAAGQYITGDVSATGNIEGGNITPAANVTYSLGNATNQWKDLWVSNATIYMDSIPINLVQVVLADGTPANSLAISTNPLIASNTDASLGNISVTGNVVAGNVSGNSFNWSNGTPVISNTGNANVDTISATGNIITDMFFIGDGSLLANLPAGDYSNLNVAAYLANTATLGDIYGGNITSAGNTNVGGFLNVQAITGGAMQISATGLLQNISLSATGNIDVGATYINRVSNPVQDQDAATKYYVDASAQGLAVKSPVVAATAAALDAYTYDNGTAGVGATITADAVGNLVVDGILLATNNRVLVKDETAGNAPYNGIYVVSTAGDPGTAFVLTRSTDNDTQGGIVGGLVFVQQGNTYASTSWFDTNQTPITVGTTDIDWVQFSSQSVSAGNGLSQTGQFFNVNTDNVTTTINGSNQVVVKASANLVTPNIGNAVGNSLTLSGNGAISTSGNVTAAYAAVAGNITTGNILTDNYLYANGAPLSFDNSGITNGTSNIEIPTANSAILFNVGGNFAGAVGANVAILGLASGTNGFYVNPVRNDLGNTANVVYYNSSTNELTYAPTAPTYGNVNVAAYLANATTNGDIYAGNIRANGAVSATGNMFSGNNLVVTANSTVSGTSSTTGNITGSANLTVAGNITGGNLSVGVGNVIAGNIEAGYYTTIPGTNGNITIDPDGTGVFVITSRTPTYFANTANSTSTSTGAVTFAGGVGIAGNLNVGGNFTAANTSFANITVSNSANLGNLTVPGQTTLTGNVVTGNVATTGLISATANVTGGNLLTAGVMSATGNATAGNITTGGTILASGNITTASSVLASGAVFAAANVTGANLTTAGTASVGTLTVAGNATMANNVTVGGNTNSGNLLTSGSLSATGNAISGNVVTVGLVTATGNVTGGNITSPGDANIFGNIYGNYVFASGDVVATGNVDALNVNSSNIYGNTLEITAIGTDSDINLNTNGSGNIVLNSTYINGILNPVQAQDAATKGYVDSVATGLQVKASSNVATTVGLPTYTYDNGTFGVGATITGNVNGVLVVDSVTMLGGERVLVKDETSTNAPYNGIYDVTIPGDAGNAYVLTRSSDDNTPASMYAAYTFITSGTDNNTTSWTCTAVATSPINIGFDAINWVQFSSASEYTNGNGLALNGTVFSVNVDNNTTAISGANVIVKAGANLTTPNIGNATGNSLTLVGSGNVSGGNLAMTGLATVAGNATVGNLLTSGIVSATGNATAGNISTAGEVSATGTTTAGNLSTAGTLYVGGESTQGGNISALSQIFVGPTANATTLTGPVIFAEGAANAFSQIGLINVNGNSSADMITYSNDGDDTGGYADMGMTGNTFNDLNYTITNANDGYFFVQGVGGSGGNLVLASGDQGNTHDIVFATGGFLTANEKLRLVDAANTLQPYANLSLDLGSNTNYFGNVYANSAVLAESFSANNITAVNTVTGDTLVIAASADLGETIVNGNIAVLNDVNIGNNISVTSNAIVGGDITTAAGAVIANAVNSNALTINGTTNLGVLGNITITGGANGQAIITDGNGALSWGNAGSGGGSGNIAAIPAVYFTSVANANNISFSNVVLAGYANAEAMTVFYNGALLENTLYTLSGDTITVNTPLVVGDNIDIPTQYGGNITTVTSGYGNSNVAAFFASYAGDIIPASANGYNLGNATNTWGNVYSYNVAANIVSASGNITGANITGTNIAGTSLSVSGNVTGANIRTAGTLSATGNVAAGGMVISGNAVITGNALVQGTLTYNNTTSITTSNLVLGLGNAQTGINVNGGGLVVGNTNEAQFLYSFASQSWVSNIGITSNANVTGANIRTVGSVSAAGNVTGNYVLGNGALLTGVVTSTSSISNGASNVNIATSSGNVTVGINSTPNVVTITSTALSVVGNVYDSTGQLYGVAASFAKYVRTTQQTTGLTVGGVIICNVSENTFGTDIAVNTTSGQVTLQPNKSYRLMGSVPSWTGSGTSLAVMWYNETTAAYIGSAAEQYNPTAGAAYGAMGGTAEAIITPSVTTVLSFRILSGGPSALGGNNDFNTTGGYPWIDVQVIGGQAPLLNQAQYGIAGNLVASGTAVTGQTYGASTNLMTFTLPLAGTYQLTLNSSAFVSASSVLYLWLNIGGGLIPDSGLIVGGNSSAGADYPVNGTWQVTVSGPTVVTAAAFVNLNSGTGAIIYNSGAGVTKGTWTQVAGLAPASGEPNWTSAGTIQSVGISATTTAPTLPTTTTTNNIRYKQIGAKTWMVYGILDFNVVTGATNGSGDYLFTLPNGLQFDTSIPQQYISTAYVGQDSFYLAGYVIPGSTGYAYNGSSGTTGVSPGVIPYSSTQYRITLPVPGQGWRTWGSGWYQLAGSAQNRVWWQFTFQAV